MCPVIWRFLVLTAFILLICKNTIFSRTNTWNMLWCCLLEKKPRQPWNKWLVFQPTTLHSEALLGRGQAGLTGLIFWSRQPWKTGDWFYHSTSQILLVQFTTSPVQCHKCRMMGLKHHSFRFHYTAISSHLPDNTYGSKQTMKCNEKTPQLNQFHKTKPL